MAKDLIPPVIKIISKVGRMKSEKGFSLIEILIALAIIGIVAVGYLSALTTSTRTAIFTDQKDTARILAQSQMEHVKQMPWPTSIPPTFTPAVIPADYPGYTATIDAENVNYDSAIEKITVTIRSNGKVITTLEDYKVQ
jgi:prepilin-type N-terminal cleavage/methylation domain-containing protein